MPLAPGHKANFNTLQQAFLGGDAALMECELAESGEIVPVVCAVNRQTDGTIEFIPFAKMFHDNPFREVNPPNPDGGFFTQHEVWQA